MIRKAEIRDIFQIVSIEKKGFHQTLGEKFLYLEFTENPEALYYVIEQSGTVVGYLGFRLHDKNAEMMNFIIAQEYQGQGLGTQLLTHLFGVLKTYQIEKIVLEVRASNIRAQHFYKKFNFYKSHRMKQYYGNEDGIVMVKEGDL